jgi:hypothetical protein
MGWRLWIQLQLRRWVRDGRRSSLAAEHRAAEHLASDRLAAAERLGVAQNIDPTGDPASDPTDVQQERDPRGAP